jgi:hypothetical protein
VSRKRAAEGAAQGGEMEGGEALEPSNKRAVIVMLKEPGELQPKP